MIECELRNSFNRYRDNFISVAIFSGVLNILMLVPAFYMLQVYDRVVASQSLSTLITLSLLALTMFLFLGALDWIRSMVLVQISHKITNQLNSRVFEISFKKTLNYQTQSSALQPLKDLTGIRQFISMNRPVFARDSIT